MASTTLLPRSPVLRVAIVLLLLAAGAVSVGRAALGTNDFDGFHRAAAHLVEHGEFADSRSVRRYPPSFPLLMAPFGMLPVEVAAAAWALLNLLAIAALPRGLERLTGVPPRGQRAAFLVTLPLLLDNLLLGQSGPLLLWMATAAVARCRERRGVSGGALIGLAAAIKVLPAGLLAVPVVLGRDSRAPAGFLLVLLAVGGAGALAAGPDALEVGMRGWSALVAEQVPARMVEEDSSLRTNNQSLPIAAWRTLGDTSTVRPRDWPKVASLRDTTVWSLVSAVLGALGLLGLVAALAARRLGPRGWEPVFAMACLGMLMLSPIVWTHYFLWVLPGVLAVRRRPRLVAWGGALFVLGLASDPLRSLGLHMACAVALFCVIAADALADARVAAPGGPSDVHGASPGGRRRASA